MAQEYLQLVKEESCIKRLHLEPVQQVCTSSLEYHLNAWMQALVSVTEWNNAWGVQQFVTLLLYLDDICIVVPTIDDMLNQIELVFNGLKQFNLKIKPKKCQFF